MRRPRHTREQISEQFTALGVENGDLVFIRASVWAIGRTATPAADTVLGGILDAIGPGGALIAPAFNKLAMRWQPPLLLDKATPPYTGMMTEMMLAHPQAVRSDHPSHSFVAIGDRASEVLGDHRADRACFEPIRRLVTEGGKMLVVGCVSDSPGFPTAHLAQFDLGLTQKHYTRFLQHGKMHAPDGTEQRFSLMEMPGCSRGFHRFHADHIARANLLTGRIGDAWSISTRAPEAYEAEFAALSANPRYPHCDSQTCLSCRTLCGYNLRAMPGALARRAVDAILSRVSPRTKPQ